MLTAHRMRSLAPRVGLLPIMVALLGGACAPSPAPTVVSEQPTATAAAATATPTGQAGPVATPAPDPNDPSNTTVVRQGIAPADEVRVGGTLVAGEAYDLLTLNPDLRKDDASLLAGHLLFDKLVASDMVHGTGQIFPALAESWEANSAATEFVFHLAPNARWHDGEPVTAADVEWTFNEIIAQEGGPISYLRGISSIEVIDDHTVKVTLSAPDVTFLFNLGLNDGPFILPRHVYEGTDWAANPANERPIGSGPFRLAEWVKGSHIAFEANTDYFLGRPPLDRVVQRFADLPTNIAAFDAGEIHWIYGSTPYSEAVRWGTSPRHRIVTWPSNIVVWLGFNLDREPFDDPRVREAIAIAINRADISRRVFQALAPPNYGIMPLPNSWWYNPETEFVEDQERAAALLDEAGLTPDANGVRLRFTFSACTCTSQVEIAQVIGEQLRPLGIEFTIEALDFPTQVEKVVQRRDFDVGTGGGFQGPDPSRFHQFVTTDGPRNQMGYSNPELDALAQEAVASADLETRRAVYHQMQEILFRDVPRFNIVDTVAYQPSSACLVMPFWEERLIGAPANYYQGLTYTWFDASRC